MNNVFRLLSLPSAALKNVLKCMDLLDGISFSFVSNRTKLLVVSLNRTVQGFELNVGNTFEVVIEFGESPDEMTFFLCKAHGNHQAPLVVDKRVDVEYSFGGEVTYYKWTKDGYDAKDWVKHLLAVNNASKIERIVFEETDGIFSIVSIKEALQGLSINTVRTDPSCSDRYVQGILEALKTSTFSLSRIPYPNPLPLHQFLIEGFDQLMVLSKVELNELLTMNCHIICVNTQENAFVTLVNRFFKLWKTGSNPRLQLLTLYFGDREAPDMKDVLKGIKHRAVPNDQVRRFKVGKRIEGVRGGCDFSGVNGRKATVRVRHQYCEMFVWPQ